MNFQKSKASKISFFLLIMLLTVFSALAQNNPGNNPSEVVYDNFANRPMAVAGMNNLYCAGYVARQSFNTNLKIVGAEDEKDQHIFVESDYLYLSVGATDGVKVGDTYSVIRPRGKVNTKWTKKKNLGKYVQEVGMVEVVKVMRDVAVAEVKTSCSVILLGDLVTKVPNRKSPMFEKREPLDRFKMSSGKANGRIFMARDGKEVLARENIVYVDLGREDNVQIGDYMTIYRKLGTGNIYAKVPKETSVDNKEEAFESRRYNGGKFSNQASRKKGQNGTGATITSEEAKKDRPKDLRRVVGELIVLNVFEKTATAMIVRNTSEIHTGDQVEVQ